MLDEPTNHLDIEGKIALAETLRQFAGGVLLVSHDRQLITASCNRFWLVENGYLSEWHDADEMFTRIREKQSSVSALSPPADTPQPQPDDADALLERLIALESWLAADLARKAKHQKPQLQQAWRQEIAVIQSKL